MLLDLGGCNNVEVDEMDRVRKTVVGSVEVRTMPVEGRLELVELVEASVEDLGGSSTIEGRP